jgi:hypothetical protein
VKLAKDPTFVRVTQRFVGKGEERHAVKVESRVRPWWRTAPDGSIVMSIKLGSTALEIEKGKAGIACPSLDELPELVHTLARAIAGGELDQAIATLVRVKLEKKQPATKQKKAA